MQDGAASLTVRAVVAERPDLQRLYEEHAPYVRALLYRLLGPGSEPDDVIQDVFLLAWRKRRDLHTADALPWLRAITIKVAAGARRRARLRRFLGLDHAEPVADWRTPERWYEQREASRHVYEILDTMSEKRRTVFILFELQRLSCVEIGQVLGCPVSTVYTRLHHARQDFLERSRAHRANEPGPKGEGHE